MAHKKLDAVQQLATGTGTGALTLGAVTSARYRTLQVAGMTDGDTMDVRIEHETIAAEWEEVRIAYAAGTITRTFDAAASSATGALIAFSAGNKIVSGVLRAAKAVVMDHNGDAAIANDLAVGGDLTADSYNGYVPLDPANNLSEVADAAEAVENLGTALVCATLAAFKALTASPDAVLVKRRTAGLTANTPLDGFGGVFVRKPGSNQAADDAIYVETAAGDIYERLFDGPLHSKWFAVGDYTVDDTTALNTFFAYASAGDPVWIDDGLYKITAGLAPITGSTLKIGGDGRGAVIKYLNGAATTATLMTIGDGTAYNRASVGGFTIESATTMGGGYGIHFLKYAHIDFDVWCGDEYSEGWKLNNAVWFDACVVTNLHTSHFYGSNRGILWSGTVGVPGTSFELHCQNAHVKGNNRTGVGIHIAGGCGGFNGENLTQLLNDIGLKVDTSITGTSNDQVFMGDADLDSNGAAGVELDNALAGNTFYSQDDAWVSSSNPGVGLHIKNWLNGKVRVGGGRIYNHFSDAVLIEDDTIDFRETDDSIIETNAGYGINSTVPITIRSSGTLQNNSAGNYHANVTPVDGNGFSSRTLDFYEQGTWVPTLYGSSTAGAPTYAIQEGEWTRNGNTVSYWGRLSISNIGGIIGGVQVGGFPFTSKATANNLHYTGSVGAASQVTLTTDYKQLAFVVEQGTSRGTFFQFGKDASNTAQMSETGLSSTSGFIISGSYKIA